MLRLLAERTNAGVDVRIIGKVGGKRSALSSERYPGRRLHVRAMIRDGQRAFLGSQSLRRLELDTRREIGVIVTDGPVVQKMRRVFEDDWALTESAKAHGEGHRRSERASIRCNGRCRRVTQGRSPLNSGRRRPESILDVRTLF